MRSFNNRLRQIILLVIIAALFFLIVRELYVFLPGFMGAITLYILSRPLYAKLVERWNWSKGWTALLFIVAFLLLIALPLYYAVSLVIPRVSAVFSHSDELIKGIQSLSDRAGAYLGEPLLTPANMKTLEAKVTGFIPTFLNSTATLLGNMLVMFFIFYFMMVNYKEMEQWLRHFIPLREESKDELARETFHMVRANAVGIPLISLIQGLTACIGYLIFGLKDWGIWGFLTGVFAFFPIVGTMIVWVPLSIYLFSQGMNWQGTGLVIYSLLVTGNVDYLARITLMKKIGNVHPLITIFGVIVGLKLFGFMGFIFGPLVFSYLFILITIYSHEFADGRSNNTE